MTVYFLETGESHFIRDGDGSLLACFDPETSLYLYEPYQSRREPHIAGLNIPTFATVSPDTSRYSQFSKNGGLIYYMPVWELTDLITAGLYLKNKGKVPVDLLEYYSEDSIRERFASKDYLIYIAAQKKQELKRAIYEKISTIEDLQESKVSSLIALYDVQTDGNFPFKTKTLKFSSEQTAKKLQSQRVRKGFGERVSLYFNSSKAMH